MNNKLIKLPSKFAPGSAIVNCSSQLFTRGFHLTRDYQQECSSSSSRVARARARGRVAALATVGRPGSRREYGWKVGGTRGSRGGRAVANARVGAAPPPRVPHSRRPLAARGRARPLAGSATLLRVARPLPRRRAKRRYPQVPIPRVSAKTESVTLWVKTQCTLLNKDWNIRSTNKYPAEIHAALKCLHVSSANQSSRPLTAHILVSLNKPIATQVSIYSECLFLSTVDKNYCRYLLFL